MMGATVPAEPFGDAGAETGAVCKCGRGRHPSKPGLCAGGHPLVGTAGPALVAGEFARTFWREQADARAEIEAAIIADAGHGPDDAPRGLRLAAASVAQSALLQHAAFLRLVEAGGPLTSRGRTRRAFTVWQLATDRLERGLRLVGLRRVPRPVSLQQRLAEAAAARRGEEGA